MTTLHGIIRQGQIIREDRPNLPDGTRVMVMPLDNDQGSIGMREEDWPTTSEGIAALLARMDQIEGE